MNSINKQNIIPFIAQLYRERRSSEAPQDLLNAWSNLSDEEIQVNLNGLFESWGMGKLEKEKAIHRFFKNQSNEVVQSEYIPEPPPYVPNVRPQVSTTQTYTAPAYPTYPYPERKKRKGPIIIVLVLLTLLSIGSYYGYQYYQFISLPRIYAITENIAIRNGNGEMVGRMDLYPRSGTEWTSYSNLRVLDNKVYYVRPEGSNKEFPSRKALLDDAGFSDYLKSRKDKICYVNVNYIVSDKKEFDLFQNAFKEIQQVASDNTNLNAKIRKIIVGSMAQNSQMSKMHLLSRSQGLSASIIKSTTSYLVQENSNSGDYVIIAGLNDGNYYRFSGNVNKNQYNAPSIIQLETNDGQTGTLAGNFRFIKSGSDWRLYSVDQKTTSDYVLDLSDPKGLFVYKSQQTGPTEEELRAEEERINNSYQESTDFGPQPGEGGMNR